MSAIRAGVYLSPAGEILEEAEAAAKEHGLTVREFLRQIIESDVASRRLKTMPEIPRKTGQGRRSDLPGYGD